MIKSSFNARDFSSHHASLSAAWPVRNTCSSAVYTPRALQRVLALHHACGYCNCVHMLCVYKGPQLVASVALTYCARGCSSFSARRMLITPKAALGQASISALRSACHAGQLMWLKPSGSCRCILDSMLLLVPLLPACPHARGMWQVSMDQSSSASACSSSYAAAAGASDASVTMPAVTREGPAMALCEGLARLAGSCGPACCCLLLPAAA